MSTKKQTAVEWLKKILDGQKDKPFNYDEWVVAFDYAKEMEKAQICDAYHRGEWNCGCNETPAQYYNETFKQQKQ